MALLEINLTKDMLELVSHITFKRFPSIDELEESGKEREICAIDFASLYGGSYVFEDIAYILGKYDEHIPGTEFDPLGPQFPKELEDYMWETHSYIVEHIRDIEDLVHQFVNKGGLKPGKYVSKSNERIWKFVE